MMPITWEWLTIRAVWFSIGAFVMFVLIVVIAPVILSGRISAWEETKPAPQDESAEITILKDKLAQAQKAAEFYFRMATERTP